MAEKSGCQLFFYLFHRFDCCLATHKFHKKQSDHKPSSSKPQEPPKPKVHHDITPVASPQRVPIPKLFAMANPSQGPAQDAQQSPQPSPYEGYQYQDAVAPVAPTAGKKQSRTSRLKHAWRTRNKGSEFLEPSLGQITCAAMKATILACMKLKF